MRRANRWSRIKEYACRPQGLAMLLMFCIVLLTLNLLAEGEYASEKLDYLTSKFNLEAIDEVVPGYLVWNPKCRMVARNPLDPSIKRFVKKERYRKCSNTPIVTKITREPDGKSFLVTIPESLKQYKNFSCCYAYVNRPSGPYKDGVNSIDSTIRASTCKQFQDKVLLNNTEEVVLVRCNSLKLQKSATEQNSTLNHQSSSRIYSNVHAILNPDKVQNKLVNNALSDNSQNRKLSILVIGFDSVSRLNFQRTMPLTKKHLDDHDWLELRGYNKMGDNTYPNLMAVLSGLNETMAYSECKPHKTFGLNNCPFIWNAFREAGYITAYGEDVADYNTFNFLKRGFAHPPTDYYMRPYILASEKFLPSRRYFGTKYCTGPESSFFRIVNYVQEFAQTFINQPYFGFFWTNSVSHDNVNGPSSIDSKFLNKIQAMEKAGVMNDSMVIILSDHGMRFGDFRSSISGWYEERLPTVYISLPPWFREQNPEADRALRINRNRLTSPYDLHETFREILIKAGGLAPHSSGCPNCTSLFEPVPYIRGCSETGIDEHWCTCTSFQSLNTTDKFVVDGAQKILEFIDNLVKNYKKKGKRQCAKFKLKKIHRASQVHVYDDRHKYDNKTMEIFYYFEVTPGGAKFETTVKYDGNGSYVILEEDFSRINSYFYGAMCLKKGKKKFCECVK